MKNVRRWCFQEGALRKTNAERCAFRGKHSMFPEIEDSLLQYVIETQSNGYAILTEMLRVKALSIVRDKGIPFTAFKASNGWIWHFMKRKNLSLRCRTTPLSAVSPLSPTSTGRVWRKAALILKIHHQEAQRTWVLALSDWKRRSNISLVWHTREHDSRGERKEESLCSHNGGRKIAMYSYALHHCGWPQTTALRCF